jgi:hypothetical protein
MLLLRTLRLRRATLEVANYAAALENQLPDTVVAEVAPEKAFGPKQTCQEIEAMTETADQKPDEGYPSLTLSTFQQWKPSCKTGGAKWAYDGICRDPEVFGAVLPMEAPPKFKVKKFPVEEFHTIVGECLSTSNLSMQLQTHIDIGS